MWVEKYFFLPLYGTHFLIHPHVEIKIPSVAVINRMHFQTLCFLQGRKFFLVFLETRYNEHLKLQP